MSRTVYFRDTGFDTLGLVIRKRVIPPVSVINREAVSIPNGPVIFNNTRTRNPVEFSIECDIIQDKLRQVYALVQKPGKLILPDEQDKYYKACLTIDTPENIILYNHHITFNVLAEPYAYSISNPETTCTMQQSGSYSWTRVTNNGTADAEPAYRVTTPGLGNFDISVHRVLADGSCEQVAGCRIYVTQADTILIDVANRIITNSAGQNVTSSAKEDFTKLVLPSGECEVRISNCTQFKITKNERWY